MNRSYTHEQTQAPPKHQVGDTVVYGNSPMQVATIVNFTQPMHPSDSPGLYYGLRTPEMTRGLVFLVPAYEVENYLLVVA
jgi:cation transport regulator ChaC